jgi:hypothetical protein
MPTHDDINLLFHQNAPTSVKFDLWNCCQATNQNISALIHTLSSTQSLTSVLLGMSNMLMGDVLARSLSTLKHIRGLRRLHLDLRRNNISASGACFLAEIGQSCFDLIHFVLILDVNAIGVLGAQHLATFSHHKRLTYLHFSLFECEIGDEGLRSLSQFRYSPALLTLILWIGPNSVGDAGVQHLTALNQSASLQKLHVTLGGNNAITDSAAALLCQMQKAPSLIELLIFLPYYISERVKELLRNCSSRITLHIEVYFP